MGQRTTAHARVPRTVFVVVIASLVLSACGGSPGTGQSASGPLVADSVLIGNPADIPKGDADKAAATLADQVAGGGNARLPALLAAIHASGLAVRDLAVGGKIVVAPAEPNQNLAFQAGEVWGMSKLLARGYSLSLSDLSELVRNFDPTVFANAPMSDMLVDGVRTAANGNVPTRRFWGRFLVELGKKAAQPYDLMSAAPDTAQLDVVQTLFILQGVFGDISHQVAPSLAATPAPTTAGPTAAAPATLGAYIVDERTKGPCSPGEREQEILDAAYTGTSYGFEKLIDYIAENLPGEGLAHFAKAIPWMNAALATIKFIVTAATFEASLVLKDGQPLIRTKDTKAGQQRELVVKVEIQTGKSTFLNCLRLILNGAGLDFSLPQDGPVDGAEITWNLLSGNDTVRLCALPCGSGGTIENNAHTGKTESSGELKVGVEGNPQKRKLPDTVTEIKRHAVVRASVNLKPAKLFQDLMDASQVVAIGGAPGLVTIPLELLQRVGAFGAGLGFDVTDWGEKWKIDVTLHIEGNGGEGYVDYNWLGTAEVSGADGTITGDGKGLISGQPKCVVPGPATANVGGEYGVVFGGTKQDNHFDLSVKGTAPSIQLGSLGPCDGLRDDVLKIISSIASDPAAQFGASDVFSFDANAGGQYTGPVGNNSTGTLKIKVTKQP